VASAGGNRPAPPRMWPYSELPREATPGSGTGTGRTGSGNERPSAGPGLFVLEWAVVAARSGSGFIRRELTPEVRKCVTEVFEPPRV
jgi:hypothetical protein